MNDSLRCTRCCFTGHRPQSLFRPEDDIRVDLDTPSFGRGQMIVRLDNGVLVGGTESRTDSNIACF